MKIKHLMKQMGDKIKQSFMTLKKSRWYTKLSYIILGFSHLFNKKYWQGIMFLGLEIIFLLFMVFTGGKNLVGLFTLGTVEQQIIEFPVPTRIEGDNSMKMLLYGVIALVIVLLFLVVYVVAIKETHKLEKDLETKEQTLSFKKLLKELGDSKLFITLLMIPLLGVLIFTVVPLIYMILIAFTNYDELHQPPGHLFDWIGLKNFTYVLGFGDKFGQTFWKIFSWTIIWAIFSTFTCFFFGMFVAMLINNKKIKGKGFFRTIFVLTIAIPSFISLMSISTMLQKEGIINILLQKFGFTSTPVPFLTDALTAKITVIIVNMWIGIPFSMLITTGILINIPRDVFESAKIDGASNFVIFRKIIMPYVMFVCTPYLINAFISNINNFNVIYFLTEGGPLSLNNFKGAGETDLLVTWLYKLTVDSYDYSYASAIGIVIFIISAGLSLFIFRRTNSYKDDKVFN